MGFFSFQIGLVLSSRSFTYALFWIRQYHFYKKLGPTYRCLINFPENFQQSVLSARSLFAIFRVFPALQTQIVLHLSEPGQILELQKQRVFCRKLDLLHLPFANYVFCFADCSSLNSNCSLRAQQKELHFFEQQNFPNRRNHPRLSASIFVASLSDLVFIIVVGAARRRHHRQDAADVTDPQHEHDRQRGTTSSTTIDGCCSARTSTAGTTRIFS